jgi:hypothetical protein
MIHENIFKDPIYTFDGFLLLEKNRPIDEYGSDNKAEQTADSNTV